MTHNDSCRTCGQRQWSKPDGYGRHWVQGGHHFVLERDDDNACRFLYCDTCLKYVTHADSDSDRFVNPRDVWDAIDKHLEQDEEPQP